MKKKKNRGLWPSENNLESYYFPVSLNYLLWHFGPTMLNFIGKPEETESNYQEGQAHPKDREGRRGGAEILVVLSSCRDESEMPVALSVLLSYYVFVVVVLKVKPYLPHEWTPKGMLERVNAFSEYYVSVVRSNSLLSNRTVYL